MSWGYGNESDPWNWGGEENLTQETHQIGDTNNSWPNPISTQNFSYIHPKAQVNSQQVSRTALTQPGNDYFDNLSLYSGQNVHPNNWSTFQHQGDRVHHQNTVPFSFERLNNNPSSEVENREIAPPDHKLPNSSSSYNKQERKESHDNSQGHSVLSGYESSKQNDSQLLAHPPPTVPSSQVSSSNFNPTTTYPPFNSNIHLGSSKNQVIGAERQMPNPHFPLFPTAHLGPPSSTQANRHPIHFQDPPNLQRPSNPLSGNCHTSYQAYGSHSVPYESAEPVVNIQRVSSSPPKPETPPVSISAPISNSGTITVSDPVQLSVTKNPPLNNEKDLTQAPEKENLSGPLSMVYSVNQNVQNIDKQFQYSLNYDNFIPNPIVHNPPLRSQANQNIPENEERVPENREHLDTAEDIEQKLSDLRISHKEGDSQLCSIDRNQYLETGQLLNLSNTICLSSANVEIADEGDAPPPGLRRLVTGQGCENREQISETFSQPPLFAQTDINLHHDISRESTPASSLGESDSKRHHLDTEGESEGIIGRRPGDLPRLIPGQSIGDDNNGVREVPGEAEPIQGRTLLKGRSGRLESTPVPDPANRGEPGRDRERDRDSDRIERMVVGENRNNKVSHSQSNLSDDYRQHRSRNRHRRDSSYEEEETMDYSSDRDRRRDDNRRRDKYHKRMEHRSPESRSNEEYEDRRGYSRSGRDRDRRSHEREYSPEYYRERDYYRDRERDIHRRHRRYDQYRGEYDDEYFFRLNRSRPSSRTDSDYRRSTMEFQARQMRHYFHGRIVPGVPYHDYERNMKEYLEALRWSDPTTYKRWYDQYMNNMQQPSSYSNDRASVHSGQSSSNQRRNVHTPNDTVDDGGVIGQDNNEDFTPRFYSTAHVRANMDSFGRVVIVDAHYPVDGQKASVQLCKLGVTSFDSDLLEFLESPGPFIPGVTHRNTVLQYLKKMSDRAISSSEKLLYDLIHLTVKTNGVVNGSDVAELLMESYKNSTHENRSRSESSVDSLSYNEVIARFRELLQQGNKTEALEWAMENRSWGHALFLASKMDDKTHNNVMLRFANSLPHNDPLQTLYQLMSGHVPQASTCCADENWSDWRPHLAMILSNPTANPNLDRKAIITLGDSLGARGRLFASQFCYVTAQVEFSSFESDAKLVLLGSSPNQDFEKFATCRAIMLTMCYEYGARLCQPSFHLPTLQMYKFILVIRLIDNSKSQVALQYCEVLANEIIKTGLYDQALTSHLIEIATRLKMFDPNLALCGDSEKEPDWLTRLKAVYENVLDYDTSILRQGITTSAHSEIGQDIQRNVTSQLLEQPSSLPFIEAHVPTYQISEIHQGPFSLGYQPPIPQPVGISTEEQLYQSTFQSKASQQDINGFQPDHYHIESAKPNEKFLENGVLTTHESTPSEQPPAFKSGFSFYKTSEDQLKPPDAKEEQNTKEAEKTVPSKGKTGSWINQIWNKLALPNNQMRLPDDKNPTIVWDAKLNRWVDLDGDDEGKVEIKPPPKASDIGSSVAKGEPLPTTQAVNKYKLQKGKLMKSNYVDVMGGGAKVKQGSNQIEGLLPTFSNPPPNTNLFVPPPVEGNENAPVDFITPAGQISRESKQDTRKEIPQAPPVPMMYNPSNFTS